MWLENVFLSIRCKVQSYNIKYDFWYITYIIEYIFFLKLRKWEDGLDSLRTNFRWASPVHLYSRHWNSFSFFSSITYRLWFFIQGWIRLIKSMLPKGWLRNSSNNGWFLDKTSWVLEGWKYNIIKIEMIRIIPIWVFDHPEWKWSALWSLFDILDRLSYWGYHRSGATEQF